LEWCKSIISALISQYLRKKNLKIFYMSLLVIGTVAFDAIETPFGKTDKIVGGAATFASLAASYFL
jgi:hypothetical protein